MNADGIYSGFEFTAAIRPPFSTPMFESGGHRYFEQSKPLLSLSLLTEATPSPRRPNESHTTMREQPM